MILSGSAGVSGWSLLGEDKVFPREKTRVKFIYGGFPQYFTYFKISPPFSSYEAFLRPNAFFRPFTPGKKEPVVISPSLFLKTVINTLSAVWPFFEKHKLCIPPPPLVPLLLFMPGDKPELYDLPPVSEKPSFFPLENFLGHLRHWILFPSPMMFSVFRFVIETQLGRIASSAIGGGGGEVLWLTGGCLVPGCRWGGVVPEDGHNALTLLLIEQDVL